MSYRPLERPTTRGKVQEIVERSLHTADPLFILSNFDLTNLQRLQEMVQQAWKQGERERATAMVKRLQGFTHTLPWSEQPARTLWNRFVEELGLSGIREVIEQALGDDLYKEGAFHALTHETFLSTILESIVDPHTHAASGLTVDPEQLLVAFLTDTCSGAELRKLGLPRNLTTEDCYCLLRFIMKCQKGIRPGKSLAAHARLWIVFDQAENVLTYSPKERTLLAKGLTHLISHESAFVTFLLNISDPVLAEEEVAAITAAYGTLIWQYLNYNLVDPASESSTAAEIIDSMTEQ